MAWHYHFTAPDGFRRVRDLPGTISTSRELSKELADYYVLIIGNRLQTFGDVLCDPAIDCIQSGGCVRMLRGYVSVNERLYDSPVFFIRPLSRSDNEVGAIACRPTDNYHVAAQYMSLRLRPVSDDSRK